MVLTLPMLPHTGSAQMSLDRSCCHSVLTLMFVGETLGSMESTAQQRTHKGSNQS